MSVVRVPTAIEHHAPQAVNLRLSHSMRLVCTRYRLSPDTAAALHNPVSHSVVPDIFYRAPAVALEPPVAGSFCAFDKGETPETRPHRR
jgi:hypothetical protein